MTDIESLSTESRGEAMSREIPRELVTVRAKALREMRLKELQKLSSSSLRPYRDGGDGFLAMAAELDAIIERVDALMDHPSIVLDEGRHALTYATRQTLTELRLYLFPQGNQ